MPKSSFRNWSAIAAWFRRGGPMHRRTAPRGGAGHDPDIIDGLEQYQAEKQHEAAESLFKATPEELGRAVVDQCRKELQPGQKEDREV
jgi:hypothetical protein